MSKAYLLRPYDKLFIKDGRSLSLEEDTAASGLFPPPPSVYYGALRTAVLANAGKGVGSGADPLERSRIEGIALARTDSGSTTLLFPTPHDLVREKVAKEGNKQPKQQAQRLHLASEADSRNTSHSIPRGRLLRFSTDVNIESVGGYITARGLAHYLSNQPVSNTELVPADSLYQAVPKLGIGLNYRSGTTADGLLYTMAMQRLKTGVRLCVQTSGFDDLPPYLRFGAEGRAVDLDSAAQITWPQDQATATRFVTLYLSTPGIFKQGWLPDFLHPETMEGEYRGARLKLVAASVGRYQPLGGWDAALRRPKPMRKAVPAGSVYHFKILDGTAPPTSPGTGGRALYTHYPHSGRTDAQYQATYQAQGFAIAYLGSGPQELD